MKKYSNSIISSLITFSIFIILGLIMGCHLPITKPKELVCPPPPPQNCRPQQWVGIPFDTISTIANNAGTYLKIEPVVLLNSPRDEWNVSFISSNIAVETYSDVSRIQSMQLVKFRAPEVASVQSSLSSEIIGSNGGFSVYKKNAVISALPKSNVPGDADLYSIDFSDKLLSEPTLIPSPISNHIDWDAQPALTPDGKVLFFASDRQGGLGGTDIWFSVNRGGDWSTPVNCGEQINSRCDDITPFVSFDGKYLLFASTGLESVGGYDIFISEILPAFRDFIRSDATIPPTNLPLFTSAKNYGAPLNTTRDELFPSSPAGVDTLLYYSSNQLPPENVSPSQGGGFDLYVLHKLSYSKEQKRLAKEDNSIDEPSINVKIHGKVTNATTKEPIINADISAKELSNQRIIDQTKSDTEGNYSLTVPTMKEIEISAQNEDLFYDSHKFRLSSKDTAVELKQNFSLPDKLFLRINFPSDVFDNPYQNVLDSNGNETTQTFLESLDLLAQNLTKFKDKIKKLILIGHTDDVASDVYNMALGKRRVEFVVTELTKRGVPKSMFEARSMGESQPLPRRENEDIEAFRKRLRRVELQKIMR